ncbi:hypothetical protein [Alkalicoccobacillus plakortidis]|uniref:Uncharacterized protein n=1 Tax=Alkalicoccobacillus plakortidis TaxID=444060 RepID=A0ABT0XEC5_9BACI|nr:hypothetical protein [Alkalicoccobacillus plakortidis]MCM2674253.1 hypothetical protein [Alkalicoccobacillus plakortidis]
MKKMYMFSTFFFLIIAIILFVLDGRPLSYISFIGLSVCAGLTWMMESKERGKEKGLS